LRDAFGKQSQRREVRIIETRCMGICPRKAVTALNASRPGRILTISKGTAADEAMRQLISDQEP
jgi:predicted metal-binding protein